MKKQWNNKIFKVVLLLLLMSVMTVWASSAIVADTGELTYSVTFQFESSYVRQITITYPDPDRPGSNKTVPLTSGEAVNIGVYEEVTVTIIPQFGYRPVSATDVDTQSQYTLAQIDDDPVTEAVESGWTCYFSQLQSNINAKLLFDVKDYNVQAIDFDLQGKVSYAYVSGSVTLNQLLTSNNKLFRYNDAENRVELPVVSLPGYEFKGWRIRLGEDGTYDDAKEIGGKYYIAHTTTNSYIDKTDVIQVYPVLEALPQEVYREDRIFIDKDTMGGHLTEEGKPVLWYAPTGEIISALTQMDDDIGGYKLYPGYTLLQDSATAGGYQYPKHEVKIPTTVSPKPNYLYRFYVPNTYWLNFEGVSSTYVEDSFGADRPAYVYGQRKAITNPTRAGYTFMGWEIKLIIDGVEQTITVTSDFAFPQAGAYYDNGVRIDPNAIYAADVENGEGEITLRALWTPNTYSITYDWNVPADLVDLMNALPENATLLSQYGQLVFDQIDTNGAAVLAIPAPVRPGYVFAGWALQVASGETPDALVTEGSVLLLPTNRYDSDLTLVATWTAESYTVIFDGAGATTPPDATVRPGVTYDGYLVMDEASLALIVPTRTGHTFRGYYSQPNGQGTQYISYDSATGIATLTGEIWKLDGEDGGTVTLYAYWEVNDYEIAVDIEGITDPDALSGIVIMIHPENGAPFAVGINEIFELPYGTHFTVSIHSPNGYKIVSFDGSAAPNGHRAEYDFADLTVEAWDNGTRTFKATVYPMRELTLDQSNVDYRNEKLQNFPTGKYIVYGENGVELATFRINEQSRTYDISKWFLDSAADRIIRIVFCGEGGYSDSDPVELVLKGRPTAPTYVKEGVGEIVVITPSTYSIIVEMALSAKGWYEYACVEVGSDAPITYSPVFEFTDLKPGTRYKIYIRRAATETEPHGMEFSDIYFTFTVDYFESVKDQLEQLKGENPGPITSDLIDKALQEIEKLGQSVPNDPNGANNYYQTVQTVIQILKEQELQVAIAKDRAINDLTAFRDAALQSGSFTDEKASELKQLCDNAIAAITSAASEEDVKKFYSSALVSMQNVPVHRLTDEEKVIYLQSMLGLDQASALTLIRNVDFDTLSRLVNEAIRTSGKVAVGSFMTQEEAEELLRALEVVASYRFEMSNVTQIREGDVFTIRLTLPENLRSMTGLQVAYYDDATGVIELLESYVDGDSLVFTASRIDDFVILADPTVELTGVIIALGAILFFQIIAIAMILTSRVRNKNKVTHASIAFPAAFLTVHFLPVNGEWIALIMAGAVVVLQIVLMALLLSSGAVHLPKRRRGEPTETLSAEEQTDSPYAEIYSEQAYAMPVDASEDADTDESGDVEADFGIAALLMDSDEMSDEDPFIMYGDGDGEAFDGEDFIEPAATTRYSLPDEEFAAFDGDEETEVYADEYAADESEDYAQKLYAEEADTAEDYGNAEGYAEDAYAYADVSDEEYATDAFYGDDVTQDAPVYAEEEVEADALDEESEPTEEELLQEELYFAPAEEDSDDTDPLYRYDE